MIKTIFEELNILSTQKSYFYSREVKFDQNWKGRYVIFERERNVVLIITKNKMLKKISLKDPKFSNLLRNQKIEISKFENNKIYLKISPIYSEENNPKEYLVSIDTLSSEILWITELINENFQISDDNEVLVFEDKDHREILHYCKPRKKKSFKVIIEAKTLFKWKIEGDRLLYLSFYQGFLIFKEIGMNFRNIKKIFKVNLKQKMRSVSEYLSDMKFYSFGKNKILFILKTTHFKEDVEEEEIEFENYESQIIFLIYDKRQKKVLNIVQNWFDEFEFKDFDELHIWKPIQFEKKHKEKMLLIFSIKEYFILYIGYGSLSRRVVHEMKMIDGFNQREECVWVKNGDQFVCYDEISQKWVSLNFKF